ncbi:hypothetical protein FNV43_RR01921 [Rhamnella rubrinervis]|uniref:ADP-ribosyl cyclase/cyclic ADP-ribose hydrolase n=1 Tax=Rhamnella rubrinervis TaxID=2594499 RepID=A0A8K0MTB5_9ROSA|nr:hypothetical protein FNV43_RR01921 [Rhamnella rubrinervis]
MEVLVKHSKDMNRMNEAIFIEDFIKVVPSSSNPRYRYEVFLSFRGETGKTFTSHLYKALDQKGFCTFLDVERPERGEDIPTGLENAIEGSNCYAYGTRPLQLSSNACNLFSSFTHPYTSSQILISSNALEEFDVNTVRCFLRGDALLREEEYHRAIDSLLDLKKCAGLVVVGAKRVRPFLTIRLGAGGVIVYGIRVEGGGGEDVYVHSIIIDTSPAIASWSNLDSSSMKWAVLISS